MILIDTGPLVALCDARDRKHRAALIQLQSFAADDFVICDAVLAEACFHLPHDSQRRRLRVMFEELAVQGAQQVEEPTFWLNVFDWMAKYADQEPDWADGCIAVLSGRVHALSVWTYDREFWTTWRRPDGSAIPMALAKP